MEHNKLKVTKVDDRTALVKILAENGYTVRIVTGTFDGKKQTYVEYWREEE